MTTRFADIRPLAHADKAVRRSCRIHRVKLPTGVVAVRVFREDSEGLAQTSSTMLCVSPTNVPEAKRLLLGGAGYRDEGDGAVLLKNVSDGGDEVRRLFGILGCDSLSEEQIFSMESLEFTRNVAPESTLSIGYHYDESLAFPWALTLAYWFPDGRGYGLSKLDEALPVFTRQEFHVLRVTGMIFEKKTRSYASLLRWASRATEHLESFGRDSGRARSAEG